MWMRSTGPIPPSPLFPDRTARYDENTGQSGGKDKWISPVFSFKSCQVHLAVVRRGGAAAKQYSLGTLGNAIAGAIVGQLIGAVAGAALEGWVGNIAGGAMGGAILMILVGLIKSMTSK